MKIRATSIVVVVVSLALLAAGACTKAPITGRNQLTIIPAGEMLSMSYSQYDQFLQENELSDDREAAAMVKRVGNDIKNAVETYFRREGMASRLDGYQWEFHLIGSDQVNAWCMPGGKVVFYEGILPICENETGVAVVMGHEVAHAVAEHGNERMSQGLIAQSGAALLSKALEEEPQHTQQLWMAAFGLGAQVGVLLPFSRTQESEADQLGLIFMAMAGYNPREALDFWKRMSAEGGAKPPEFLSTHPSDQTRMNDIKGHLPEALKHYQQ